MSDILHSRKILLLISGPAKRDAYKELLRGGSTPRFPASFLWLHSGVTCICDRAAAGELDKP
jgi:galactosamine-6-phosphate isomerase